MAAVAPPKASVTPVLVSACRTHSLVIASNFHAWSGPGGGSAPGRACIRRYLRTGPPSSVTVVVVCDVLRPGHTGDRAAAPRPTPSSTRERRPPAAERGRPEREVACVDGVGALDPLEPESATQRGASARVLRPCPAAVVTDPDVPVTDLRAHQASSLPLQNCWSDACRPAHRLWWPVIGCVAVALRRRRASRSQRGISVGRAA